MVNKHINRYKVIKNVYTPNADFKFPVHKDYGKMRRFSYMWLKNYSPWLVYSKVLDGGFCLPCIMFAKVHGNIDLGILSIKPLTTFNKATELLRKHSNHKYHKNSMADMSNFVLTMENCQASVCDLANTAQARLIEQNRCKLKSILKCILLCGEQNIALRGHRDDEKYENEKGNTGNFKALLHFRVDSGDIVLKHHFETAARNATYSSKTIQNELISVIREYISIQIINEVKEGSFFTVLADEVADVSVTEQLCIVLRYVNKACEIKEHFLEFVSCECGVTGEALSSLILSTLQKHGLDITLLRGQGYDGAGAMIGSVKGVAARIRAQVPLAVYTHCFSHKLNLVIVNSCKIQSIRNAMGSISKISSFFGYPKRQTALENKIKETEQPNKKRRLLDVCRTRWVYRHDALENFGQFYEAIVDVFEDIKTAPAQDWNSDTISSADCLQTAIMKFEFLISFVVLWKGLAIVKPLSVSLQSSSIDICKAYKHVSKTRESVKHVRDNIDNYHSKWFDEASKMGDAVGADKPVIARRCGRQRGRDNVPAEQPKEYYKRSITIPFFDHLLTQLDERFSSDQQRVIAGLSLVPAVMTEEANWKEQALDFAALYEDDLQLPGNMDMELVCWESQWKDYEGNLPSTPQETLKQCSQVFFPNIHTVLRLICTLPVTSCTCERSISGLKRLKTYLRSTMSQDRLNGLALMHFHCGNSDIGIDYDALVDMFSRKHPRRMKLLNVLDSDE